MAPTWHLPSGHLWPLGFCLHVFMRVECSNRGRRSYEATCVAGPFALSTRWTTSLQAALQQKQALLSIRACLEKSKDAQANIKDFKVRKEASNRL